MDTDLDNFLKRVNDIYGLYRDALLAFPMLAQDTEIKLKQIPPTIDLKKLKFGYGESHEEMTNGTARHISVTSDFIERNKPGGKNHITMANFCIVLIYAYWEYHRNKIKTRTGHEIQSDLMYDIKIMRHAIIHNKGVLHRKLKILEFKKNENIKINKDQFDEIVDLIKSEIKSLKI